MIYADALASLFAFGGIYAVGTFGMSLAEVIRFGVMLNIAAGLGAFAVGWVDFGLFALSRKATNFIGPMAVASITNATGSQRIGIAILIGFFTLGLVLLLRVNETSGTDRAHVAMARSS
jgi:UMF1 family MFS transporter